MSVQVQSTAVAPLDVSLVLNGSVQQLVPVRTDRTFLQFQNYGGTIQYAYGQGATVPTAPATPTTPTAGWYILTQGQTFTPNICVPGCAVYVFGTNAQIVTASAC